MLRIFAVFAVLCISQASFAYQEGWYLGGGIAFVDTRIDDALDQSDVGFGGVELVGGYKYDWYLGGEIRLGTTVESSVYNFDINTEAKSVFTHYEQIYYRIETLNDTAKLYGLLGMYNVGAESEFFNRETGVLSKDSASENGFSYGIGVGFTTWNQRWNTNIEYRNSDNFVIYSLSVDRRF